MDSIIEKEEAIMPYNTIGEALEALRAGELVLVTDDPGRENEGDLI